MPVIQEQKKQRKLLPYKPRVLTMAIWATSFCMLGIPSTYAQSFFKKPVAKSTVSESPTVEAKSARQKAPIISFNIPTSSGDEALIAFANQAELTVVFPYNKVRHVTANQVVGNYTPQHAIAMLLDGSPLHAEVINNKRIKILSASENSEKSHLLSRLFNAITAQDDSLIAVPDEAGRFDIEYIEVRGVRARVTQSVGIKHDADVILDTIQSVEMGKFPDQNLAEALQRVSGVSIDRAEGEGQLVTVRGFGPEFNRVLINGRPLATDKLGRAFSFDTLASEIVSSVTVHKQAQAAMQSGGIGATIDIETAKPLSFRGMRAAGSVKMQYDTNSANFAPSATAMFSNTYLSNRLGLLASFTHHERDAQIEEAQIDGWLVNTSIPASELPDNVSTLYVPRNYDQRVRFDQRTRTGAALVLQYRPSDDVELAVDYLGSQFDVDTAATSMGHWFTSSNLEDVILDSNGSALAFSQSSGHATDFHARTFNRSSNVQSLGFSADWAIQDHILFDADISISNARVNDKNGEGNSLSLIGYLNQSAFDHTAGDVLPAISGFQSGVGQDESNFLNPANGRSHVMLRRGWNIDDDIAQGRVNITYLSDNSWFSQLNTGVAITQRDKTNERRDNEANARHCTFCGYFENPDIPDSFQTVFDAGSGFLSSVSGHESIPHQWLQHNGATLFNFLQNNAGVSLAAETRGSSFAVEETVYATYLQFALERDLSPWFIDFRAGLRTEYTHVNVNGVDEQLSALIILDQTELGQEFGQSVAIKSDSSYVNWLPSVSMKLGWRDEWVLRTAYNHSLTRPTLEQMAPGVTYTTTRQGGDLRARIGNPQLLPFEAINMDVAIERYYQNNSYVSLGIFRKEVDNFIISESDQLTFDGVTDPSTGSDLNAPDSSDELAIFTVNSPNNGRSATVEGVELSLQHLFRESGWGLQANASYVRSNAELDTTNIRSTFALTGLSGTKNVVVFYEKDALQWRLAWNHRDGFLQSLNQTQSTEPTFVAPYQQWDMSVAYDISSHISLFAEGINLTNETVHKRGRFSNQLLLVQDSGTRYALGINVTY
ncbi:TonB-dependent receptor [Alteromonas sp. CI.11.F.A3]|uniref:TonB-dependent receptor n=1 Tax=Alteromonas sp. CI.11.F.A3 TaxID=3079555 RepID=UPI0029430E7B|nr:TonB-dependent receptor [Alteromonas sp. CI.11.F.A3]WOI37759.1 TonB-dependent receptor [Alteromonas sp. CI.11.F.A3]